MLNVDMNDCFYSCHDYLVETRCRIILMIYVSTFVDEINSFVNEGSVLKMP